MIMIMIISIKTITTTLITKKALRETRPPPSILRFPLTNVVLHLFHKHILMWNDISICHTDVRILFVLSCVTERDNLVLWKTIYTWT